jgi:hypothetical protein
MQKRGCE